MLPILRKWIRSLRDNGGEQFQSDGRAASQLGRFREILSDPLSVLIQRDRNAGRLIRGGFVVLHNGNLVPFRGRGSYYGEFSDILVINRGVHEPLEEFCFQRVLRRLGKPNPTMVEVGAYWAHYSMWLKTCCAQARCIMAEPNNLNLRCGRANFERNKLRGEFFQEGVPSAGPWLPDLLKRCGLVGVDILHADVQGAELALLLGATELLQAGVIGHVFISTHSDALHQECTALLAAVNYRVEVSSDLGSQTTSSDGFIYASNARIPPLFHGFTPLGREQLRLSQPADFAAYLSHCISYC